MASAWNAAVAYLNLADDGVITASSSVALAPPSTMQNPHVGRKWRSIGNNEAVVVDLGAQESVDTVALFGANLTAAGTTRLRIATADTSGQAGDAYSGASAAGRVDPAYGSLIFLLSSPAVGRYVRIDLADASLSYIEAGRSLISARNQFPYNFGFGWSRSWKDRSRRVVGRGGQTFVDPDVSFRTLDLSFEWLPRSDRYGFVEEMDRVIGAHDDVLMILDPTSDNLGRDSIWGLMDDLTPVTQAAVWIDGEETYSKAYRISERL